MNVSTVVGVRAFRNLRRLFLEEVEGENVVDCSGSEDFISELESYEDGRDFGWAVDGDEEGREMI